MNAPTPKRPPGRPPVAPEDRLQVRSIRLKAAHWDKLDELGMERLRRWLENTKVPKE